MALPREKELKFRDVLERSTYADVLDCMIDKEVLAVMYNRMENIIEYFHEKLGLQWPSSETDTIIEANLLRNCIVHNNAVVDSRLATHGERWSKGATIALTYSDVNRFGVAARSTAEDLYGQAEKRFLLPRTR